MQHFTNPLTLERSTISGLDPIRDEDQFLQAASDMMLFEANPDALQLADLMNNQAKPAAPVTGTIHEEIVSQIAAAVLADEAGKPFIRQ
jgi:hypothetical protein